MLNSTPPRQRNVRSAFLSALYCVRFIVVLVIFFFMERPVFAIGNHEFPRLMGMNIGEKNYYDSIYQAQLARMDVVILGFFRGWGADKQYQPIRYVVRKLKLINPYLLVGQYTILNEANDDAANSAENDVQLKLHKEGWWLKNAYGRRVQWTSDYKAWDINITDWSRADEDGLRYPEWLAQRDYRVFFEPVPEFDIWYFDNVMAKQRIDFADWKMGKFDQSGSSMEVQQAFRRGEAMHWEKAHALAPKLVLMGNADNDLSYAEYKGRLTGVFLEGLMGKSWSLYEKIGWGSMMARYHAVFSNLGPPRMVGFNVAGRKDDYRFLRLALTSCLLGDGYFSFTDSDRGYSSVPWFDEYDQKLGKPLDPPQDKPWHDGIYRRRFENGMVVVNPGPVAKRVEILDGYAHFTGKQAPQVNDGRPVRTILLAAADGVLLIRDKK